MGFFPLGAHAGTIVAVLGAGFFAGFIDSIVGGGGLIQLPALFAGFPNILPPALLGTNKLGSICGTLSATLRYMRTVKIPWAVILPAAAAAFLAALGGALLVSRVSPTLFRPLVPVMLLAVLGYVLLHKDLGTLHAPKAFSTRRRLLATGAILVIGFYDGFFGPGTGSFLMLLFIRMFGFDFLHASAAARTVNVATNAGALLVFGVHGKIFLGLGIALGITNALGSLLGTHTAIKHGSRFVRGLYVAVVVCLIARTAWDAVNALS